MGPLRHWWLWVHCQRKYNVHGNDSEFSDQFCDLSRTPAFAPWLDLDALIFLHPGFVSNPKLICQMGLARRLQYINRKIIAARFHDPHNQPTLTIPMTWRGAWRVCAAPRSTLNAIAVFGTSFLPKPKDQFCANYSAIWRTEALGMSPFCKSFFRQKPDRASKRY